MHTNPPELMKQPTAETLPTGKHLEDIYALEFAAVELPNSYRMAQGGEHEDVSVSPDVSLGSSPETIQMLQQEFVKTIPYTAARGSWWTKLDPYLAQKLESGKIAEEMPVIAKHHVGVYANGKETNQGYDIIEMNQAEDPATVEVVADTLKLIDQMSGGLMAAQTRGMRVVLIKGVKFKGAHGGEGEGGGFALNGAVCLNTDGIRRWEGVTPENFHEVLAAVTVHEVLGHGLERAVQGDTGRYYDKHFDYKDYVEGKNYPRIASTIEPKVANAPPTEPVREYGRISPAEDVATSVDASVSLVMGWAKKFKDVPRLNSTEDSYRRDLVMSLMDQAAQMAKAYDHAPGFVGNELRYTLDADGSVAGIEPVRSMEINTQYGAEAVRDEIQSIVKRYTPKGQFVVGTGDWV